MNCPWCGKEMKAGAFEIERYIYWDPADREPKFISWSHSGPGIQVLHKDEWKSVNDVPRIKAYHCPACRKFIFDGMLNE